jgi:hypothetical protein
MEPSFDHMTTAERVLYVQDLWDRIDGPSLRPQTG